MSNANLFSNPFEEYDNEVFILKETGKHFLINPIIQLECFYRMKNNMTETENENVYCATQSETDHLDATCVQTDGIRSEIEEKTTQHLFSNEDQLGTVLIAAGISSLICTNPNELSQHDVEVERVEKPDGNDYEIRMNSNEGEIEDKSK